MEEKQKKYILTDETMEYDGHILHRIKYLSEKLCNEQGGWIESEHNLSQEGYCGVFGNAIVYEDAQVVDNAVVYDFAIVCGEAYISGNAQVYDNATVCGDAYVTHDARVYETAFVKNELVDCYATISGNAIVKNASDFKVFSINDCNYTQYFTWTRSNNKWRCGDFYGTSKELIKNSYKKDYWDYRYRREYRRIVQYVNNYLIEKKENWFKRLFKYGK